MMKTRKHSLLRSTRIESGQAILLIAFMMVGLIGVLGMAIDGGGLYFLHRDTQNAADAAVLAALYTKCTLYPVVNDAAVVAAGTNAAMSNGFQSDDRATVTIDPSFTPSGGSSGGLFVRSEITARKPSYFIQIVYPQPLLVTSSTVGQCFPSGLRLLPFGMAIISLRPTGCSNSGGGSSLPPFRVRGRATVNVHNASIYVNSNNTSCAVSVSNNAHLNVDGTCAVVGEIDPASLDIDTGDTVPDANCETGVVHPSADELWSTHPLQDLDPPDDACVGTPINRTFGPSVTNGELYPGHYGNILVQGTLHLHPGLYCIRNLETRSGARLTGDNVVIYMPPGVAGTTDGWHSNAQSTIDITAPGTRSACPVEAGVACDWSGLLLWADITDAEAAAENVVSQVHMNGNGNSKIMGMIYGPRSECRFEGGSDGLAINSQIVCWSLDFDGNTQLDINFEPPAFLQTEPSVVLNQ